MAFDRWNDKISAAADNNSRQQLLAEIGSWRAKNLTDIPAMRDAASAMARLYSVNGDRESAVREARSLLSLCQTPPAASGAEVANARAFLSSLGEKAPVVRTPRGPKPSRDTARRDTGTTARGGLDEVLQRAAVGDYERALGMLKGRHGRAELARTWIRLSQALSFDGAAQETALVALERDLRTSLGVKRTAKKKVEQIAPAAEEDGQLGELLGRQLPRRRDATIRLMEQWLEANPDGIDEITAAALLDHQHFSGSDVPAPWIAGFVARAKLQGGEKTAAALQELRDAGSVAVKIYDEPAFEKAMEVISSAGDRFSGLRRGVLGRRAEPEDRRAWTLRFDGGERMLVIAPPSDEPYPQDIAATMAERLPALCTRVVLLASGVGNAPLREAVAVAGMISLDGSPSVVEMMAALDRVGAVARPPRGKRERGPKKAERTPVTPSDSVSSEPSKPDPMLAVAAVLSAPAPTVAEITAALAPLPKLRDAFLYVGKEWAELPDDASARLSLLLEAADAVAPQGLRVPEAVTLALRVSAAHGGPTLAQITEGPASQRFGGPGIADLVKVVAAASTNGWSLRRAFRGTTRRERRNNPALQAFSGALDGVWRLGVERDNFRAEIWYVADLPIEGRGAIPQLLLDARKRVVLLPIDPELVAWYGTINGPDAIGWTGDEVEELGEALNNLGS